METRIALAGNPNCGKTTMFNDLTGSSQYVGNWPGVTVEKKEGKLKGHSNVIIEDLPGIYSLSPYTLEEVVARNYLVNEKPDVILNIIDGSNIERNLYLTTQLIEIGIPMVIALNMMDVVRKNGDKIDTAKMGKELGVMVVETSAVKGEGSKQAAETAMILTEKDSQIRPKPARFSDTVEKALVQIEKLLPAALAERQKRWFTVKLFERDEKVIETIRLDAEKRKNLEAIITAVETEIDDDSVSIITAERYEYINKLMNICVVRKKVKLTTSDKIDRIVTNRWLGLPIFALVMFLVYYISISTIGTMMTDWVNDVLFGEIIPPAVESFLVSINTAGWLQSLILDGIIAGVGAVLGFLPQMLTLFLLLAFLEDCGYMARIAFVMDRIFRRFGLSGKSFIPILIATGCGVPGIMASRTIENDRDRKMTIITTTFIPCSAKLPIIALLSGALFPNSSLVAPSAYFLGIAAIIFSGIILKKTRLFAGDPAPFVMELPAYHWPTLKGIFIHMWDRGKAFVKKAGTIIFVACGLVWFLSSFSWSMQMVDAGESMLASIGRFIAMLFTPLGWGTWQATVATITGLIAKENVVGTFGILYGFSEVGEDGAEIWGALRASFTQLSAYSFLVFNLLCAPCFAAIGAINREMGSAKWTWIAIGYQTLLAYASAFVIYQIGLFVSGGSFNFNTTLAVILVGIFLYLVFRKAPPEKQANKKVVFET
ncbi:MAG: ferrous iron transport protein B [Flexilinea sp.]